MKTLAKKDLKKALALWAQQHEILSPIKTTNGDCIFDTYNEDTFTLDYKKPPLSPKSVFFPQAEIIFEVENNEYREVIMAPKRLLFGIRACDMMGIRQAAGFMSRDNPDTYYQTKRDAAALIVMACPGPQNETCFCTTMKSGPVADTGFDLQLYDTGDDFLVEIGTPRGRELLTGLPLTDVEDQQAKRQKEAFRQKAIQNIPEVGTVVAAMKKLKDNQVAHHVWEVFGEKCITCGGCAFVCPTCTCFNVYDQQHLSGGGLRLRAWDACLYSGFTRETSGHNPRVTQALRLKRRHEHKLVDFNSTDIQDALCGCVGCGRCSDYCPVHIGTLEVVQAIAQ